MSTSPRKPELRDTLVNFVGDMLAEQPADIFEFMQQWAEAQKKLTGPQVKTAECARDTLRNRHVRELPSCYGTVDSVVDAITVLFARYKELFHEKREGARDHYMMALEDSGYDMFHLRQLEEKIQSTRATELRVEAQEAQTNEYIRTILADAASSPYAKVERLHKLFAACRDSLLEASA